MIISMYRHLSRERHTIILNVKMLNRSKLCVSVGLLENDTDGYNWVDRVMHGTGRDGQFYCQILRFKIEADPWLPSAILPTGIWAPATLMAVLPSGGQLMTWLGCTAGQ